MICSFAGGRGAKVSWWVGGRSNDGETVTQHLKIIGYSTYKTGEAYKNSSQFFLSLELPPWFFVLVANRRTVIQTNSPGGPNGVQWLLAAGSIHHHKKKRGSSSI